MFPYRVANLIPRVCPSFRPSTRHFSHGKEAPYKLEKQNRKTSSGGGGGYRGTLKGHGPDRTRITISKNMSRLLRHDARLEGMNIRDDGYVLVKDLLAHPSFRNVDLPMLEEIVKLDAKQRFHIYTCEASKLWICANQGHSISNIETSLTRITAETQVPMAVHGTTEAAWKSIKSMGISRMSRNHIHLAQGVSSSGVISGLRNSSRILIYIDLARALASDIPFFLSRNGCVLTPGNVAGFLEPQFFKKVECLKRSVHIEPGWESRGDTEIIWAPGNTEETSRSQHQPSVDSSPYRPPASQISKAQLQLV